MLEGLEQIDWGKLQHAYGPAEDVPGLLRGLASPEKSARGEALHALWGNIWHQGTVYEATSVAAPFLIELATNSCVQGREEILLLLASIANGNSYLDVHQHVGLFKEMYGAEMTTEKWTEDLGRELSWVKAARAAVVASVNRYVGMLDDSDWPVREAAAFLLAALGSDGSATCSAIEKRFVIETEARVKVSFLLALGVLGKQVSSRIENAASDPRAGVRLAAALSMVRLLREQAPDAAVELLIQALQRPEDFSGAFEGSPWCDDGLQSLVTGYLTYLGPSRGQEVATKVIYALKRADGWMAKRIAMALLAMVFDISTCAGQRQPADLTDIQRAALAAVCKSKGAWKSKFDMGATLRALGLPEERGELEKFL